MEAAVTELWLQEPEAPQARVIPALPVVALTVWFFTEGTCHLLMEKSPQPPDNANAVKCGKMIAALGLKFNLGVSAHEHECLRTSVTSSDRDGADLQRRLRSEASV